MSEFLNQGWVRLGVRYGMNFVLCDVSILKFNMEYNLIGIISGKWGETARIKLWTKWRLVCIKMEVTPNLSTLIIKLRYYYITQPNPIAGKHSGVQNFTKVSSNFPIIQLSRTPYNLNRSNCCGRGYCSRTHKDTDTLRQRLSICF